jgi:plasmid segregation protein ParM
MQLTGQSPELTIGLDVGYGMVKAITPEAVITFPSVCGHARALRFQAEAIAARHPGDQVTDSEGAWFVGDLAQTQLPPGELLRLRGRTADETAIGNAFRVRLAKAAFGKLLPGLKGGDVAHIRLCTGLPVDHLPDAPGLKAAFLGQHRVKTDTADFVAHVIEVMVMPQPQGTIFAQILTPAGTVNRTHRAMRTGVVDVGAYTVDLALNDDGEYIDAESGSVEGGVSAAQERLAALLERDYRQKIPYKLVEAALRTGYFRARGEVVDYSAAVREVLAPLRSATLSLMGARWQTGATLDVIYLSGGGAPLVAEAVRESYPQTVLIDQPQLANARGYLSYALFTACQPG